jgi:hypothetical protein
LFDFPQLGLSFGRLNARQNASDHLPPMAISFPIRAGGIDDSGHQKQTLVLQERFRRQHSDYGIGNLIQGNLLSNNARVAAIMALPELIGQHHDLIVAADSVFAGSKAAP